MMMVDDTTPPLDRASMRRRVTRCTTKASRAADSQAIAKVVMASPMWNASRCVFCYMSLPSEVDTAQLILNALEQGKQVCVPYILDKPGMMEAILYNKDLLKPGCLGIPTIGYTHEYISGINGDARGSMVDELAGYANDLAKSTIIPADQIDLALVPGLAYDLHGARLGRGGGYYDRYLARCPAYRIALAYDCQVFGNIPTNEWDQFVHALALPSGLHSTGVVYGTNLTRIR